MGRLVFVAGLVASALLADAGMTQQIEADPRKDYNVTPAAGPWMICAASFTGDLALNYAHDLVVELRGRYGIPAYVFNRGAEQRREQQEQEQRQREEREKLIRSKGFQGEIPYRIRRTRIEEQCAVLVGGFRDIDTARDALKEFKKKEAPKSVPKEAFNIIVRDSAEPGSQNLDFNPFIGSFVAPNPTVPLQKQESAPDPFLKTLNAAESYSLLQCPKPWTLMVKDFSAPAAITTQTAPNGLLEKLHGKSGDVLNGYGHMAHDIAKGMREIMHLDAYILHTRNRSVICVGNYDRSDDPQLLQNQRTLAGLQFKDKDGKVQLQLSDHPAPMQVPRP